MAGGRAAGTVWGAGALALAAALAPAQAANLQISPVMINFRGPQGAAGITLQNLGEAAVYGQVRVYLWEQRDGDDVLTPTQEVVASPPLVQIAPKSSQTIRLVRRQAPAAGQGGELSYRVLIDEVPRAEDESGSGVDIRLRYSVPVFMLPADARSAPLLAWRFYRKDGGWMMQVRNSGQLHAQIGATSVSNAAGKEYVISNGLMGYALAGRQREWKLPLPPEAALDGALTVKATINAKAVTAASAAPEP